MGPTKFVRKGDSDDEDPSRKVHPRRKKTGEEDDSESSPEELVDNEE